MSVPSPLACFRTALAFSLLRQIGSSGHRMKVAIDEACVYVTARFKVEGSVLAPPMRVSLDDVQTHLQVDSKAAPDRV